MVSSTSIPETASPLSDWQELVQGLKTQLKGKDAWGQKGSLRWLEQALIAQGGKAGTVRNILYKNLASLEEKRRFFKLLNDLYHEAGLPTPKAPEDLQLSQAKKFLDRDKRQILARFVRKLRAGDCPQQVVVGGPATGKSILIEQLRETLPQSHFVNLAQDIAPALVALAEHLGIAAELERELAKLSQQQPFALQAEIQQNIISQLAKGLNAWDGIILLRAESEAKLAGLCLRGLAGEEVNLPSWLEALLQKLQIPYLATLSSKPPHLAAEMLQPPSREEARRFLQQRLPFSPADRIERLLNQAAGSYAELSRLSLLELSQHPSEESDMGRKLLDDPKLGQILKVLAVLSPEAEFDFPLSMLEELLGKSLQKLSPPERMLFSESSEGYARASFRRLLPPEPQNATQNATQNAKERKSFEALHQLALESFQQLALEGKAEGKPKVSNFRLLYHAHKAHDIKALISLLEKDPLRLSLMKHLWTESTQWPLDDRENLARIMLRYGAILGNYDHEEVKEALLLLRQSAKESLSQMARVKWAEAAIDKGNYSEAAKLMAELSPIQLTSQDESKAETLLVEAALARWQGNYELAEAKVNEALGLPIAPLLEERARLWQGLVAKDGGHSDEALKALSHVKEHPLLSGRARYQAGDLLMRLGRPKEAKPAMLEALELLSSKAPQEELSRVEARLATVERHLGQYKEAEKHFESALDKAPDAFIRARVSSEASILAAAQGHPWEAIRLAAKAEQDFRRLSERPAEREYRHKRSLYRLAIAYWVDDSAAPYRQPFRGSSRGPNQAKNILNTLIRDINNINESQKKSDRYLSLYIDCHLALALMSPPKKASSQLNHLIPLSGNPFLKAQIQLALVECYLRQEDFTQAAALLTTLRHLPPHDGLKAWQAVLEAELLLSLGQSHSAAQAIEDVLKQSLPLPFRSQLGRIWGQILNEKNYPELAPASLKDARPLDLSEALALHFED
ncbi:MAG: hypothetical protein R2865_03990, partial [Deinococcales bacterium]